MSVDAEPVNGSGRGGPSAAVALALLVVASSSALVGAPRPLAAQDYDDFAAYHRLERRLRARPDDTRLLCELGWLRHRLHLDEEADVIASDEAPQAPVLLDRGIALLGEPTAPALRRRLAACLYSRGRVAEVSSLTDAIPYYERSLALRPSVAVTERLDGARRAAAARWTQVPGGELEPEVEAAIPRPAGDHAEEDADEHLRRRLVARWRSALGHELLVLSNDLYLVVATRAPGGAWRSLTPAQQYAGSSAGDAWLEAPVAAEVIRVVVTWTRETRVTDEDGGPDYGAYIQASTVAIGADGTVREIATDPWW